MAMERRILHVDFNGFYASVACRLNPALRPHPVAVAGDPEKRHGIILAKNENARRYGVKTGEPIWQARKKCPQLVTVPPDFAAYLRFSEAGRRIYESYSDRVEGFGLDENWIDISGTTKSFGEATQLAERIREQIKDTLGITVSVGVADNKVFAKLGSDLKKPDAVSVVSPDNYRQTAWPLPMRELLYVGRATESKLRRYGIETIGDIANAPPAFLKAQLGKCGLMLHAFANGLDASPVLRSVDEPPVKSVGNGVTTPRDLVSNAEVYRVMAMLSDSVGTRLRALNMRARTVHIAVRDSGLYTFTRQCRLPKSTNITDEILRAAMELFCANYRWQTPVRALSVTAGTLLAADTPTQLSLFDDESARRRAEALDRAVDSIRDRYGRSSICRAALLDDPLTTQNPNRDHTVHPVGLLHNGGVEDVIDINSYAAGSRFPM